MQNGIKKCSEVSVLTQNNKRR